MSADLDFLAHLARESDRFAEVLLAAEPMQPVPSCPDWTTIDLFWHLTEVQWFWGAMVRERAGDPSTLTSGPPQRPVDLDSLGHVFATVSADLEKALAETPPETSVWTWSDDRTAGFVRRRQAHEALIHRVDAELATGRPTEIDAALAGDGVDEVLRGMLGRAPAWGAFEPRATVRLEATDTGQAWTVAVGRFRGTDPDGGEQHDRPSLTVRDEREAATEPAATVRGPAADLDCWLWGRLAADRVERDGDETALAEMQAVVEQGID